MIIISKIFNKILLDIEMKFLSGLSFLIISLVCFHFIFYLNFYNFSGDWIEKESSLITVQVMPNKDEKRVPDKIKQKLDNYFNEKEGILSEDILDDSMIKDDLGLSDLNSFSNIRIPLIFQLKVKNVTTLIDKQEIIPIIKDRKFQVHYHKNDLYEISNFIYRVKIFIFLFGTVISLLFVFLLTLLLKSTLKIYDKFFEIIQIMGANSIKISANLSFILMKKILPGSILGMLFASITSYLIIKIFNFPSFSSDSSLIFTNDFTSFFYLVSFLVVVLVLLFLYLLLYLFYFLEKRFFA
ncbi:MAG: hypothetical protein CMP37_04100 [Rickettsiales bacterium]|nr:hypothetical protein [Rickettsiales bacterium]OUW70231.1 MAG: hypothetical protein CBD71_04255 [Rickettsiales bacterium TMED211]